MAADKRRAWRRCCAACGDMGRELHEHHLVPRVHGGADLPTVMLCGVCHGLVHGREFRPDHAALTRAGLARARARGVKLGSPRIRAGDPVMAGLARQQWRRQAQERADILLTHIEAARAAGAKSLGQIAAALTARGILTPAGSRTWQVIQVQRVISKGKTK